MPHEQPTDIDADIAKSSFGCHKGSIAGSCNLYDSQENGIPHEDIRFSLTDYKVGIKILNGKKSTSDTKNLHDDCTFVPFVCNGYCDEFGSDE